MNQVTNEQKDRVMKTLAVFGFLAVVIFGVWLAVQIVSLMPQAFSSLASIADGVYNYRDTSELTVSTEKSVVNAGEPFIVSWDEITEAGEYTFTYDCTNGVSLDIRNTAGEVVAIDCGEELSLGDNLNELEVTISSERERFSDIAYTVAFVPENEVGPSTISENMITVVNASIPDGDVVADTDDEDAGETGDTMTDTEPVDEDVSDDTSDTSDTPATPSTDSTPGVIEETVYETPVSDPNGYTDLAIRLVAVGQLDDNGNFEKRANIDEDARGAFQFEVKNVGTKTSDEWDFVATLTSGTEYNAPLQTPLKPQERVLFTLGYDNVGDNGISMIAVTIRGDEMNADNNSFTWAVSVVE